MNKVVYVSFWISDYFCLSNQGVGKIELVLGEWQVGETTYLTKCTFFDLYDLFVVKWTLFSVHSTKGTFFGIKL